MNNQAIAEEEPGGAEEEPGGIAADLQRRNFPWFTRYVLAGGHLTLRRSKRRSFLCGMIGILFLACLAISQFIWVAVKYSDWFDDDQQVEILALTVSTIYAWVASTLAIATFVPLMGSGRLTMRFIVAVAVNLFVLLVVCAAVKLLGDPDIDLDDVPEVGLMILAFVLGVGVVAVPLQLWSSTSVVPLPSQWDPPPRTSILDLMELMMLIACVFAFSRVVAPADDMTFTLGITGAIGICFGIQLIPLILGYFENPIGWRLLALAFALTFIVGATCIALIIADEVGTIRSGPAILAVLFGGLITASIYLATTWIAFGWLRGCGWATIRKSQVIAP